MTQKRNSHSSVVSVEDENIDLLDYDAEKDESVDYIYTDPPFGANIIYSDMNLLLEGWLKVNTNNGEEAIVDETANKTEFVYSTLMKECFSQCYRKLKKDHWMSVEFHNTKASIWNILHCVQTITII